MKKSCVKGADYGTFGERLRAWRERKGLSLSECARRSGCSKAWLSQVELGHIKDPSIAKVAPVCQEIGVTVDELFWGPPPVADEGERLEARLAALEAQDGGEVVECPQCFGTGRRSIEPSSDLSMMSADCETCWGGRNPEYPTLAAQLRAAFAEERVPDGWYIHGLTHKSLDTYVQRDEPGDQDWYYSDPDELLGLTSTSCGMDETCDLAIAAAQEAADE